MTGLHDCPTCQCPSSLDPCRAVVLGLVERDLAPVLYDAWDATTAALDRAGLEWRPVMLLAARVAEETGCAPSTVENLLRVARATRILDSRKLHFGGRKVLHVRKRKDPIAVACEAREWEEHVGRQRQES